MNKIKVFILVILLACTKGMFAQDYHLSQYDMATMYMNPALTGMYGLDKGDYKIYNDYRSQWASLSKPFSYIYLGYDMPFHKWNKNFGLGAYIMDNRAPAGAFNTMNFMVSAAYNIINKAGTKHYLTTGIQMGVLYKYFDPNSFTYDNQYSAADGGFDQTIPSNEVFGKTSKVNFDANFGLYYKYIDEEKKYHPYAGFSIQHVTMPNESFTPLKDNLPMRFNGNVGCDFEVSEKLTLDPMFLYMNQAQAYEFDAGLLAFYKIGTTGFKAMLGGDFRLQDAVVIQIGIKAGEDIFRFSYDINTSYLNAFSGGRGAWEFSLVLTGIKGKPLFSKSMFSDTYNKF